MTIDAPERADNSVIHRCLPEAQSSPESAMSLINMLPAAQHAMAQTNSTQSAMPGRLEIREDVTNRIDSGSQRLLILINPRLPQTVSASPRENAEAVIALKDIFNVPDV